MIGPRSKTKIRQTAWLPIWWLPAEPTLPLPPLLAWGAKVTLYLSGAGPTCSNRGNCTDFQESYLLLFGCTQEISPDSEPQWLLQLLLNQSHTKCAQALRQMCTFKKSEDMQPWPVGNDHGKVKMQWCMVAYALSEVHTALIYVFFLLMQWLTLSYINFYL